MDYRGDDLDLQTPRRWSPVQRDAPLTGAANVGGWARGHGAGRRGDPIWVDDIVIECCNLAHELAAAHRAGEVRLEHLVNALTRVDQAALILEQRAVHVAALRRESAGLIASDAGAGLASGRAGPRTSRDLEEVLRRAAERAYQRGAPATIDDLLPALAECRHDSEALSRLLRVPLGPAVRAGPEAPRADEPRARVRAQAGSLYIGGLPRPSFEAQDTGLTDKLTALEHTIEASLAGLADRIGALEARLAEPASDAIGTIEKGLSTLASRVDESVRTTVALTDLLGTLERTMAALGDRVRNIESAVAIRGDDLGAVSKALRAGIDGLVGGRLEGLAATIEGAVKDRVVTLEAAMATFAQQAAEAQAANDRVRTEVRETLVKLAANQQTLSMNMDQWRLDNTGDLGVINNRLESAEILASRPVEMLEQLCADVRKQQERPRKRKLLNGRFKTWLLGGSRPFGASWRRSAGKTLDRSTPS